MELEQRVKALEYEMKIVKNEIQRTLLDIQEQVLIHYYPSLRSDDTVATKSLIDSVEILRAKQSAQDTPTVPAAKKVSLDEVRSTQNPAAAAPVASMAIPIAPTVPVAPPVPPAAPAISVAPSATDPASIIKLVEWTNNATAKLGSERVGKLLEVSTTKGIITSDVKNVMFQIVTMNKGAAPERVVVNQVLEEFLKLDGLLGRAANAEEALTVIEEAKVG